MTPAAQVKPASQQVGELVFEGRVAFAVPIERAVLRDSRLSWAARGLFIFLWDLPSNWRPCLTHLAGMGTDKVTATRSAMRELEAVGALRMEKMRDDEGRLQGQRWVVVSASRWAREAPLKGADSAPDGVAPPECGFPSMGKSDPRFPRSSGNRTLRVSNTKGLQSQGSPNTNTTTTPRARAAAEPVVVVSEEDQARLIWPPGLAEDRIKSIRDVLLGKWPGPANAQALLDELAGQLAVPGKVKNAPGLMRKLLERQRDGLFSLEHGLEVQQVREARRKQQEREAAAPGRKGQQPREQAHGASPEAPAVDQAGLASARQLLSKLRPTAKAGAAG